MQIVHCILKCRVKNEYVSIKTTLKNYHYVINHELIIESQVVSESRACMPLQLLENTSLYSNTKMIVMQIK